MDKSLEALRLLVGLLVVTTVLVIVAMFYELTAGKYGLSAAECVAVSVVATGLLLVSGYVVGRLLLSE